jgi:7-carboxy-7-deazaguanine synthase
MSKILIAANPDFKKEVPQEEYLLIAEMFSDTIQGEGISAGVPSVFLRVQNCVLNCVWCDSNSVWRQGNPYSINEILEIWQNNGIIEQFKNGVHLIFTGGSPMRQQDNLVKLIEQFYQRFKFKLFIEIENEAVLSPNSALINIVDQWNNSPKLISSRNPFKAIYKPEVIDLLASLENSYFKFVISTEDDWKEIEEFYLLPNLIRRDQVILMPCGQTREELNQTREQVVNIAIRENIRYSDRLHVIIWDKKTGV